MLLQNQLVVPNHATAVHGLRATDDCIKNADEIRVVWAKFMIWFNTLAADVPAVILVTWNGERCNLKWLWKICQAPNSLCSVPNKLQYFMDPYKVITSYKSCQIHPDKSWLESLSCGGVFHFLYPDEPLEGLHNSLVDCKLQTDIIIHPMFVKFINRKSSIQLIMKIFQTSQMNKWRRRMEPSRPVHGDWIELTPDNDHIKWQPTWNDNYLGPQGGPKAGPTRYIVNLATSNASLADIFFGIMPISTFDYVQDMTEKYCYHDYVVEKDQLDCDGNVKKKKMLVGCDADTPGARHHVSSSSNNNWSYPITTGFVLAWFAMLILQGAHFGTNKRTAKKM